MPPVFAAKWLVYRELDACHVSISRAPNLSVAVGLAPLHLAVKLVLGWLPPVYSILCDVKKI